MPILCTSKYAMGLLLFFFPNRFFFFWGALQAENPQTPKKKKKVRTYRNKVGDRKQKKGGGGGACPRFAFRFIFCFFDNILLLGLPGIHNDMQLPRSHEYSGQARLKSGGVSPSCVMCVQSYLKMDLGGSW